MTEKQTDDVETVLDVWTKSRSQLIFLCEQLSGLSAAMHSGGGVMLYLHEHVGKW